MFVLKKIDGRGGYLAQQGSDRAYTHDLAKAQTFTTKEVAAKHSCPENEVPLDIRQIMRAPFE